MSKRAQVDALAAVEVLERPEWFLAPMKASSLELKNPY